MKTLTVVPDLRTRESELVAELVSERLQSHQLADGVLKSPVREEHSDDREKELDT